MGAGRGEMERLLVSIIHLESMEDVEEGQVVS